MRIRPCAQVVVWRGDDLLVLEGTDHVKPETYCRLVGGGIEFGERADEALRRELREELAAELTDVALLGVLQNIFTYNGQPGHEVVFVFEARFADPGWYERDHLGTILDGVDPVSWQPLSRFTSGATPLYPDGLLPLLAQHRAAPTTR